MRQRSRISQQKGQQLQARPWLGLLTLEVSIIGYILYASAHWTFVPAILTAKAQIQEGTSWNQVGTIHTLNTNQLEFTVFAGSADLRTQDFNDMASSFECKDA
jgi:hypothetical protein